MANRRSRRRPTGSRRLSRADRRSGAPVGKILVGVVVLAMMGVGGYVALRATSDSSDAGPLPSATAPAPTKTKVPDDPAVDYFYAKDTPYPTPTVAIKPPPDGYTMFFIENVGRHGSRSDTNDQAGKDVLKMWRKAKAENALTDLGQGLEADIKAFDADERAVGFGQESTRGKAEWNGIGQRTATNYQNFFAAMQESGDEVRVVTTPVNRTKVSMSAFIDGLTAKAPDVAVKAPTENEDYVNFDSSVSSQGYKDLDTIKNTPEVETAADNILKGIFVPEYVDSLNSKVEKVLDFYGLYATAAGMSLDTDVTFHEYFPLKDVAAIAYARDAGSFYKYGPGVKGESQTYTGASLLRGGFFKALDDRINGGRNASVFRIAHGETTMPFAALLQLPGSEKQAEPGVPFSYDNNPWRGATAGLMAGNVEWVAYRDNSKNVLVTMRYNEVPALFRPECTPVSAGSYFYSPDELKRCLPSA